MLRSLSDGSGCFTTSLRKAQSLKADFTGLEKLFFTTLLSMLFLILGMNSTKVFLFLNRDKTKDENKFKRVSDVYKNTRIVENLKKLSIFNDKKNGYFTENILFEACKYNRSVFGLTEKGIHILDIDSFKKIKNPDVFLTSLGLTKDDLYKIIKITNDNKFRVVSLESNRQACKEKKYFVASEKKFSLTIDHGSIDPDLCDLKLGDIFYFNKTLNELDKKKQLFQLQSIQFTRSGTQEICVVSERNNKFSDKMSDFLIYFFWGAAAVLGAEFVAFEGVVLGVLENIIENKLMLTILPDDTLTAKENSMYSNVMFGIGVSMSMGSTLILGSLLKATHNHIMSRDRNLFGGLVHKMEHYFIAGEIGGAFGSLGFVLMHQLYELNLNFNHSKQSSLGLLEPVINVGGSVSISLLLALFLSWASINSKAELAIDFKESVKKYVDLYLKKNVYTVL